MAAGPHPQVGFLPDSLQIDIIIEWDLKRGGGGDNRGAPFAQPNCAERSAAKFADESVRTNLIPGTEHDDGLLKVKSTYPRISLRRRARI